MNAKHILITALVALIIFTCVFLIYQFSPTPPFPELPDDINLKRAVWMGVTWSMDEHSDGELQQLADDLQRHDINYAYVYVTYLKENDEFNQTYDHAAEFVARMHELAPDIKLLAWIGVPLQITTTSGETIDNRLESQDIRQSLANFSASTISDMGFDGVHLNMEQIPDHDPATLETLQLVRDHLPDDAILSTTAHALAVTKQVTSIPYPRLSHHWSGEYLRAVSEVVDQLAVMAYDSGLIFPADYRSWMQYQTREITDALADSSAEIIIGVPTSEEWTSSHHVLAETLANALYGLYTGIESVSANIIDGIAVYPYWETDFDEWNLLNN